jgi:lipopolysaccharide transport system ATP-binding protein
MNSAIRVCDLSKAYKYYRRNSDLLKEVLTGKPRHEDHWALKDISFEITEGQVVGIIGPNGSGKSTLLRIITGLLDATSGTVEINGRVSAILELGTGFHPDFSGRENIITGGLCLGMTRSEIEERAQWIIDFSELDHVIDQPFKTYSSGMQARLTFSTAVSIDPEVLIIDEALAAGDAFFVAKSFKRIREICKSGATVLFVSHGTGQIAQICDTAIWLDGGTMRAMGPARDIAKQYDYETHVRISEGLGSLVELEDDDPSESLDSEGTGPETFFIEGLAKGGTALAGREVFRKGPVKIESVRMLDGSGRPSRTFQTWHDMTIEVVYSCPAEYIPIETLGLAIGIERESDLVLIAQFNTVNYAGNETEDYHQASFRKPAGRRGVFRAFLSRLQMMNGEYLLSIGLLPNEPGTSQFFEYRHRTYRFQVTSTGFPSGAAFYPNVQWSHEDLSVAMQKVIG